MTSRYYAIFSAQYPPHLGGIENFTLGLSRALVARGDRVLVVTNDTEDVGAGEREEDGVRVLRLPCYPLVSGRLPLPRHDTSYRRLVNDLERRPFDGVLVNARFYPHSLLGLRIARGQGITPVLLDHGSAYLSFSSPVLDIMVRAYERGITQWGRRYRADYYGISEKSAEWLKKFGIAARGVITNAIDAEKYRNGASNRRFREELRLSEESVVVAFVGRLIHEKGIESLIDASRDARLASKGVTFVLAGDGPLADDVRSAEGPSLRWVGRLSREDTAALLLQADLMCLPTRSEGFSTTLLEASACGCPSLVTDVGGARELIPDEDFGRIMPDASPETIARELIDVLDGGCDLRAMGARCQTLVESQFSWNATAAAVERALLP